MALQIPHPTHGGQLRQIAKRYGLSTERLIDFSVNVNPAGPPESVQAMIRQVLEDPAALMRYPDLELVELKQTIADYTGVQPNNIAVANGFVPLLEAALRSLKVRRCLLPVPSFSEYRTVLENADIDVTRYSLSPDDGFRYEPGRILRASLDHTCDAILMANPQNPSGALCNLEIMQQLITTATQHNITILLDEAFIDYCPLDSSTRLVDQANVVVFRSVTKFFAIPGLRVAYAVANASKVHAMNRFIAPWPITSVASDGVRAALYDGTYAEMSRLANDRRRLWLGRELARLGITTYPSGANFLLLRFPAGVNVNLLWEKMIVEENLVVRSCTNFEGLAAGHLRVAVRSEEENERLIHGLERRMV